MISSEAVRQVVREQKKALVDFTRRLVQTPSPPGQEQDVARLVAGEMQRLGYDEVWTDEAGNVIGKINGRGGSTILLNGHMDHVDPGPEENWPHPPFSGRIVNDCLWGRAAVDMKGPLACMIYAAAVFKYIGLTPPGDIYMTAAVMEETGGLGSQHLAQTLSASAAICGEPSRNILRRGHRGRVELEAIFKGRSAHASVPHLGQNPHYAAAAFLLNLPRLDMPEDPALGRSSVAPTLYRIDQSSPNVIPGEVRLTLDWRNLPVEPPDSIVARLADLLPTEAQAEVRVVTTEFTTYTGMSRLFPSIFPAFLLPEDSPYLQAAHRALVDALGRDDGIDVWRFATDGGHLMQAGIPTVGFGPGDERLAHTSQECISLPQMEESVVGYVALLQALAEVGD
ncbi:MAG: M20/M25/M40 family metallo-hydrolase [Chloroflexi bacterium]|nr:MAG: M20/M25/M40 family metallo-hydrolase [Chloroflexota bacterium]